MFELAIMVLVFGTTSPQLCHQRGIEAVRYFPEWQLLGAEVEEGKCYVTLRDKVTEVESRGISI